MKLGFFAFFRIIPLLILPALLIPACQNGVDGNVSSSAVSSAAGSSSSSPGAAQSILGEWLVLYETYEVINSDGIISEVITNSSTTITDAACYTLLFKSNSTADLIDYTNGAVSIYSTNYYTYKLYENTGIIELVSPIDVEETVYYEPAGRLFQGVTNSRITNATNYVTNIVTTNVFGSLQTNVDPQLSNEYYTTNFIETNVIDSITTNYEWEYSLYETIITSNFTFNYQVTNVVTDQRPVFMQPVDIYDTVKNSKSTISIFNYKYTLETGGTMKWKPSLESCQYPADLRRSHTRFVITENAGTNGVYQKGYSYMHFPEFNSIVDFKKIR